MNSAQQLTQVQRAAPELFAAYDEDFFNDMLMMFLHMGRGEVSKYMYDNSSFESDTFLWEKIVKSGSDYYVPEADSSLMHLAREELARFIPEGTPYADFGVGGQSSFERYAKPTMELLKSKSYIGVDFDQNTLNRIKAIEPQLNGINITPVCLDFFKPTDLIVSKTPALGVMNGVTLGNMYGALSDYDVKGTLVAALKYLSQLTAYGWLLVSIDTNQDEESLLKMYLTPLNSHLNIASIPRMAAQLPVTNFDPSLFIYKPEWRPEQQLIAHLATATEDQDFELGEYPISVKRGDRMHMFNSYKFRQDSFEDCCPKAGLEIEKSWTHKTGVMLYLLKDVSRKA